jgi:hypothetical protein
MTENIITQVSQESTPTIGTPKYEGEPVDLNSQIHLNIRGKSFTITRDELMSLPESILLCLFPNGVFVDVNNQVIANLTEDDIVYVNFEPSCFQYIIDNFQEAQRELMESSVLSPLSQETTHHNKTNQGNVLQNKPAIIVLREDLDYYVIPPISGLTVEQMRHLKLGVAEELLKNKLLFSGLGYDPTLPPTVDQKLGPAEKHLLDMLCTSGFERNSEWGSRSIEPSKCVILSLLLVRLRTTPPPAESRDSLEPVESGQSRSRSRSRSRLSTLANSARAASRSLSKSRKSNENHTKLLLFWRKPARKCWWSNEIIDVNIDAGDVFETKEKFMTVKVHIRRVWTLELSVIGVQ